MVHTTPTFTIFNESVMDTTKSNKLLGLLLVCLVSGASAFELLSEGAMGSVSAVSANSAEEIINIAGSPAAGLRDDDEYEPLPFVVSSSSRVAVGETDKVSDELNFSLTQEVQAWASELRSRGVSNVQVGVVDELPESSFQDAVLFVEPEESLDILFDFDPNGVGDIIIELSRVDQTVELLESGVNTVTYTVERYVERASTVNATPFPDQPSIGSAYISDLRSISNVGIARVRD